MAPPGSGQGTRTSRVIEAPRDAVYRAFTDPAALTAWRAPGDMTATMHDFDLRTGGGYTMSLYYPATDATHAGKTASREDRFSSRFVALEPPARVVEVITFEADDPAFSGEMTMEVMLDDLGGRTQVTIAFRNLPSGVRPEDNDVGTRSSLDKLASYLATHLPAGTSDSSEG